MLTATELKLTPDEIRLIQNYRQLCGTTQRTVYAVVADCTKSDLQRRPELRRPVLRLIPRGAQ